MPAQPALDFNHLKILSVTRTGLFITASPFALACETTFFTDLLTTLSTTTRLACAVRPEVILSIPTCCPSLPAHFCSQPESTSVHLPSYRAMRNLYGLRPVRGRACSGCRLC